MQQLSLTGIRLRKATKLEPTVENKDVYIGAVVSII